MLASQADAVGDVVARIEEGSRAVATFGRTAASNRTPFVGNVLVALASKVAALVDATGDPFRSLRATLADAAAALRGVVDSEARYLEGLEPLRVESAFER